VSALPQPATRANFRESLLRERDTTVPPGCAFKTGSGSLVDLEFFAQTLQLCHGYVSHACGSRARAACCGNPPRSALVASDDAAALLANHDFLKRIEIMVRRDSGRDTSILAATPGERAALARWLGFVHEAAFWAEQPAASTKRVPSCVNFSTPRQDDRDS
jgi:glutamine synthetase adenylyltransferase